MLSPKFKLERIIEEGGFEHLIAARMVGALEGARLHFCEEIRKMIHDKASNIDEHHRAYLFERLSRLETEIDDDDYAFLVNQCVQLQYKIGVPR